MIQESNPARKIERVFVVCGLVASLLVVASALLPQNDRDPQLWFSVALCILSILAGIGYFRLRAPASRREQPAIGTSDVSKGLAVFCDVAALAAVLVAR